MIPFQLGPFELYEPFARGGMGEIWHGRHVRQDVPVAVKVLTGDAARKPRFRDAFLREVEAVARLEHSGIVMVFDVGEVTVDAAEASAGRLGADSPWLAMELARGGALTRGVRLDDWEELKRFLLNLLTALAHAHARGVIHRDLKPGNVLLFGDPEPLERPKLSDFGIAQALGHTSTSSDLLFVSGTPGYMAPEQIAGRWRDHGPWTDLYAVGCIAYELATGHLPFRGGGRDATWRAHLLDPMPSPECTIAVPDNFEAWLARLLAKRPWARFRRAGEAARALELLEGRRLLLPVEHPGSRVDDEGGPTGVLGQNPKTGAPHGSPPPAVNQEPEQEHEEIDTVMLGPSRPATGTVSTEPFGRESTGGRWQGELGVTLYDGDAMPPQTGISVPSLSVPEDWRNRAETVTSVKLIGAGLGLFGLRPVPLVGRKQHRDTLWRALQEVDRTGEARVVCLQGPAGCGKSRLAEWLCETAHEAGVASVLKAPHSPMGGAAEGLPRMLANHFRLVGLDRPAICERLSTIFKAEGWDVGLGSQLDDEVEALADFFARGAEHGTEGFLTARERRSLLARMLERIASRRIAVLWLDDVQWAAEALSLALHLTRESNQRTVKVLTVVTVREDLLDQRPVEKKLVSQLCAADSSHMVDVPVLTDEEQANLLEGMLRLDGSLARQVVGITRGNPLFAVQLVGDWIDRGLLETGDDGFELATTEELELPGDIHSIWAQRLDRLLLEASADRLALMAASALGVVIDTSEWMNICETLEVQPSQGLLARLAANHLVERTDDKTWRFGHGMVRDVLEESARASGEWPRINKACAEVLAAREDYGSVHAERHGRHLLAAGMEKASLEPMGEAFEHHMRLASPERAEAVLDVYRTVADRAGDQYSQSRARYMTGVLAMLRGEYEAASGHMDTVLKRAEAEDWSELHFRALLKRARTLHVKGNTDEAGSMLENALRLAEALDCSEWTAEASVTHAEMLRGLGQRKKAQKACKRAISIYEDLGDRRGLAIALFLLSTVLDKQQDAEEVTALLQRSINLSSELRHRDRVALGYNGLGEVARLSGRLEEAEEAYRVSLAIYEAIDAASQWIVRSNLGMVLLAAGRYKEAYAIHLKCRDQFASMHWKSLIATTHAALMASAAGLGRWEDWDEHCARARELLEETGAVDLDLGVAFTRSAELAKNANETRRADSAAEMALHQWTSLDRPDMVARVKPSGS